MTNLARVRREKGISAQKLAEYCDISVGSVHKYEQNKYPIESCRISILISMGEKLNIPFYELFDDVVLKRRVRAQLVQGAEPEPRSTSY